MKWILRQFVTGPINSLVYLGLPAAIVLHVLLYKTELSLSSFDQLINNLDQTLISSICLALALSVAIFLRVKFSRAFATLLIAAFMINTIQWMLRDINPGIIGESKQRIEDYFLFRLLALDLFVIISLPFQHWMNIQKPKSN